MATTKPMEKGDLVHMLAGKDRGKQGRVLESRPRDGGARRELKRAAPQKPRPMRDTTRMGGADIIPGGILERPMPLGHQRDGRLSDSCGRRRTWRGGSRRAKGRSRPRSSASEPAADRCSTDGQCDKTMVPRVKERYERGIVPS